MKNLSLIPSRKQLLTICKTFVRLHNILMNPSEKNVKKFNTLIKTGPVRDFSWKCLCIELILNLLMLDGGTRH